MATRTSQNHAPIARRGDLRWIRAFRRLLAEHTENLCELAHTELGKPPFETLTSDIVPLLASCRWHERHAGKILRARRLRGGSLWQLGQRHRVLRVPLGRVAIIATWNYPIQLLGIQLVQAVAAGNSVVVKPSERSPDTQGLLLDLARRAGLGEDRLTRTEATREAGERLLNDEVFDHVVFTGSTSVGRGIAKTLGESLTPSTLELSGCDSAIVLSNADPVLAARSVYFALSLNSGQTCMAPRRAIVHQNAHERFVQTLRGLAKERPASPPTNPEERERCEALARDAVALGGRAVAGSLVVDRCPPEAALAMGEHFGPAMAILVAESDEHAVGLHTRFTQHLATSLYTRSTADGHRLAAQLGAGTVTINDTVIPTAHPAASVLGRGPSGWGASRGELGLLAMTRPVCVSRTASRPRTPLTPPSEQGQATLRRLVTWWYGR